MSLESLKKYPIFDKSDINAVSEVLKSGNVNRWSRLEDTSFEDELSKAFDCKYAIALSNGTAALECALYALDIKSGDEVITTCRTFVASASAVIARGATPIVVDVDLESQNITADSIEKAITKKTKAIIVVHLAGWPCDMDSILKVAKKNKLNVIEDCAQSHGAKYRGKSVGSFGDIGCISFCQDKIVTTCGEGGAIVTNNKNLYKKIWAFKDHGKNFDKVFSKKKSFGFKWLIDDFGTNMRMTRLQMAQGLLWLKRLDSISEQRNKNANMLIEALSKIDCIRLCIPPKHIHHAYYKFYCFLKLENLKKGYNAQKILSDIQSQGVPCGSGACWNISEEKAFKKLGISKSKELLPNAYKLKDTSLMFLVHQTITKKDMDLAIKIICDVLKNSQK